jgi:hypothetical protein
MRKRIMAELPLRVRSPGVQNTMHIAFVNAAVFRVYNRRVTSQILCLLTLRSKALPALADHTTLHA